MEEIKGTITAEATINGEVATERAIEGRLDVAGIGGGGSVDDVQINGTSIVVDKVANIPIASEGIYGVTTVSGEKVDAIEKRVDVLEKMSKGILYDFVTQTVEGTQSTPKGSHLADVQKLEGKSIVWNQLFDIDTVGKANGRYTKKDEGLWEVVFSVTGNYKQLFTNPASVFYPNHKYYTKFKHANADISYYYPTTAGGSSGITLNTISTVSVETNATLRAMHCEEGQTDTISLQLFDLTQMFGTGNEPTIEQFEQMFPNDYYPYNVGELQSVDLSKMTVRGKNLLDVEHESQIGVYRWYLGVIPSNTKARMTLITKDATADVSGCFIGFAKFVGAGAINTYNWVLQNGNVTGHYTNVATMGEIGYLCSNVAVYPNTIETVEKLKKRFDIQVELGDVATDYAPYITPTEIPLAFVGKSAGTVRDELDLVNKKYIQRVGSVDLGSLTWARYDGYNGFNTTGVSTTIKHINRTEAPNQTSIYNSVSDWDFNLNLESDFELTVNTTGMIKARNLEYTDVASFKTAMNGVMLYYELAEPIITDVSDVIDSFSVEGNGTIEFDSSIPVKNTIEYLRYLNEV